MGVGWAKYVFVSMKMMLLGCWETVRHALWLLNRAIFR